MMNLQEFREIYSTVMEYYRFIERPAENQQAGGGNILLDIPALLAGTPGPVKHA